MMKKEIENISAKTTKTVYQVYDRSVLRQWNWGAFVLTPFWALTHGLDWWFFFSMMPGVHIIARFYMGWYGSRLAFEKCRYRSLKRFMKVQRTWSNWGILVFSIATALTIAMILSEVNS
jgi:4-hydroxybenzoate polyprenyltransferase